MGLPTTKSIQGNSLDIFIYYPVGIAAQIKRRHKTDKYTQETPPDEFTDLS